jgi:hypothetical protein
VSATVPETVKDPSKSCPVFIPDDCFTLIKQFAGIYSIGTKWHLAKNLSTQTLLTYFLHNFVKTTPSESRAKKLLKYHTLQFQKKRYEDHYKSIGEERKCTAKFVKKSVWFIILLDKMTEARWIALNEVILLKIASRKTRAVIL